MTANRAERLRRDFLRFRDRGDAAALARVFDALGPALLLVAAHLAREPEGADDLVQATFLAAMRSAADYDPGRDLQAWLLGILRNRAADAARRRRRREMPASEDAQSLVDERPGPAEEAASREAVASLRRAIEDLPARYREVAVLRVVHGMEPVAIARALGRPAGTVRMQCRRAVDLLRRALPAGFAGGVAWLGPVGRSWASVRTEVLQAAQRSAVPVTGGAAFWGGLLMTGKQKVVALVAGVLMLGAGAAWTWGGVPGGTAETQVGQAAASPEVPADQEPSPAVAAADAVAADADLQRVPRGTRRAAAVVTGRCVDERGVPLAGTEVEVDRVWRAGTPKQLQVPAEPVVTGRDGRFVLSLDVAATGHRMELAFRAEDRCACTLRVDLDPEQTAADVGDVVVPRGIRIAGRVVDTEGRPVRDVTVDITGRTMHDRAVGAAPRGRCRADTDERGRFGPTERIALAGDTAWFSVRNRQLVGSREKRLAAVGALWRVELEVRADVPAIRGTVVGSDGRAVRGAYVGVERGGSASAFTDGEGRFVLERSMNSTARRDREAVELRVTGSGFGSKQVSARWGDTDLRIELERLPELRIRVVEAADDQPVERYALTVLRDTLAGSPGLDGHQVLRDVPLSTHTDGELRLDDLEDGALALRVEPDDPRLAPTGFVDVPPAAERPDVLTVRVAPLAERLLRVTTPDGAPCGGVDVECIDSLGHELQPGGEAFAWRDWNTLSGGFHKALVVDRGRTDEGGELALRGAAGRAVHLRLRDGGVALQVHGPFALDDDAPLEIVATPGAVWRGAIRPPELARDLAAMTAARESPSMRPGPRLGLELTEVDNEMRSLRRHLEPLAPIGDDGEFELTGLPPGRWQALLHVGGHTIDVTRLELSAGETLEHDLHLAAVWPSRLVWHLFVDGELATERPVVTFLHRQRLPHESRAVNQAFLRTDADGALRAWSFPGRLEIDLRLLNGRLWSAPIEVPAGRVSRRRLELRTAPLDLVLRHPDGTPAADWPLRVGQGPWALSSRSLQTDDRGRCRIEDLVAGSYHVEVRPADLVDPEARATFRKEHGSAALREAWVELEVVDVRAGEEPAAVTLTLPDSTRR